MTAMIINRPLMNKDIRLKFNGPKHFFIILLYCLSFSSSHAALRIGVLAFDPPLVISKNQGFYVDLANTLCRGLNEQCTIVTMQWDKLFIALNKGEIDLQMGVFPTLERSKKYLFSIPFMVNHAQFIALTQSNLANIDELNGKKVGTLAEEEGQPGVFQAYIKNHFHGAFKVIDFMDIGDLLHSLSTNSIQAALLHSSLVTYWVANSNGRFSTIGPSLPIGEGYSIIALPSKQPLINAINQQLKRMMDNGDYAKIYNTYFGESPAQSM